MRDLDLGQGEAFGPCAVQRLGPSKRTGPRVGHEWKLGASGKKAKAPQALSLHPIGVFLVNLDFVFDAVSRSVIQNRRFASGKMPVIDDDDAALRQ